MDEKMRRQDMWLDFYGIKNKTLCFLIVCLAAFVLLFGCGKKPEDKPHPTPFEEKRICSFSISNLDSEFPVDDVSLTVHYGINSVNLENYKAVFTASDNSGKVPSVLQCIESVEKDDYSFTVLDGKYNYKKESALHFENSFFDRTDGEFFLSLCLLDKTDNTMENPIAGYQYALKYVVTNGEISFEIKGESVVRHH